MAKTISVSGVPKRVFRYLIAGFVVYLTVLFGGLTVVAVLEDLGVAVFVPTGVPGMALFAVAWFGLTVLWVRRMRGWEGSDSMWDPIPQEQYLGRFADAGGIARHNWEKAIEQLPDGGEERD